ncbi:MAG: hypothetical protein ACTHL1_12290 [Burkholderiaceae bacterium]
MSSMPAASVLALTRLRLRSPWLLPRFLARNAAIIRQATCSPGFLAGAILPEPALVFWTMTLWESPEAMRGYVLSGPHRAAMPALAALASESRTAQLPHEGALPSWDAAYRLLDSAAPFAGRLERPSPDHQAGIMRPPRFVFLARPLKPAPASSA